MGANEVGSKYDNQPVAPIRRQADAIMKQLTLAGIVSSDRAKFMRNLLENEILTARLLEQQRCCDKLLMWNTTNVGHEFPIIEDTLEQVYLYLLSPLEAVREFTGE